MSVNILLKCADKNCVKLRLTSGGQKSGSDLLIRPQGALILII